LIYDKIHGSFILLYGPLLYFYLKTIRKDTIPLRRKSIHLIPFLLGLCYNIFLSFQAIIFEDFRFISQYNTLLLPSAFVSVLIYSGYALKSAFTYQDSDVSMKYKLTITSIVAVVLFIPFVGALINTLQENFILNTRIVWYASILFMFVAVLHFRFKIFLELNQTGNVKQHHSRTEEELPPLRKYQTSGLQKENAEQILKKLKVAMEEDKLYKDCELSLESLALHLNTPKHHISQVLNDFENTNFYHFINHYRIREAKSQIKNNDSNTGLLTIAFECGFKSKSTFNKYFKEFTGKSPSEYQKKISSQYDMIA
jgi:AraC-like DNA-binding protein